MTFTSTHKEALAKAHDALFSPESEVSVFESSVLEQVILTYVEERGAKIVPADPTMAMLQEIKLLDVFSVRAMQARFTAMLSVSPDPFTDEVSR